MAHLSGIPAVVTSFDKLAGQDIDTVYIAVPNHLHYEYTMQALEAGLHVIVEKPVAATAAQAERMAARARDKGKYLLEAVTVSTLPGFEKIRDWLPRIGQVKSVSCQYLQYSRRYDAFCRGEILPVFDPVKAGGALMDLNTYNLHFVLNLFGKPEDVHYFAIVENSIDTGGTVVMSYPGFQAVCMAAKTCSGPSQCIIAGTQGTITTSQAANTIGKVSLQLQNGQKETFEPAEESRVIPEFERFMEIIDGHKQQEAEDWLAVSLAVSGIHTQSRKQNDIVFPADGD
ncbi:Gfo/Idh/MocA family protein [Faecalibaculum rodentium]|uniref:Gfo/Idh/MocA family protein n=1 Tax=Faecalibaculum rodentium TaxID=1702221 RepID=UPI0023EFCC43|nr:Gfo/Idh/MocA family oxidoreductase [Faecalibaculum rodentium]